MSDYDLLRDRVAPLPVTVADKLYHENAKTITIGGEYGTVAWVDLWRGIFLCDVLAESPVLQDIPLPLPARGNWGYLLKQYDPSYFRDVTISRDKGCIRYIEMEMHLLKELDRKDSRKCEDILDSWNVRTWSMAIPVGSWEDWQPDCQVDTKNITMDVNQCPSKLLSVLSCSDTSLSMSELPLAYPILSMNDDIVYLLSRHEPGNMNKLEMLFAIDVKKGTVQGVTELDAHKNYIFMPTYCISEICMHLEKNIGTRIVLEETEKVTIEPTGRGEDGPREKEGEPVDNEVASGKEDVCQQPDLLEETEKVAIEPTGRGEGEPVDNEVASGKEDVCHQA